jgi:thiaminase/transcriptional activator TenA
MPGHGPKIKVFCFFSSEKKIFLVLSDTPRSCVMTFDIDAAMPFAAGTLYAALRRACGAEWLAYVSHRFVRQLAAGTLPSDEFVAWLVQDYLYLVHYARAYALLAYKSGTVARMRSAAAIVHGLLHEEMALHRQLLAAEGIDEAELSRTPETLETLAYGRYILDRAQAGDELDLVVTLSACLAGYGEIGLLLLHGPDTKRAGNPYLGWIQTYGGPGYIALVKEGLQRMEELAQSHGGTARFALLLQQFRQSVLLETAFWNAGRTALEQRL